MLRMSWGGLISFGGLQKPFVSADRRETQNASPNLSESDKERQKQKRPWKFAFERVVEVCGRNDGRIKIEKVSQGEKISQAQAEAHLGLAPWSLDKHLEFEGSCALIGREKSKAGRNRLERLLEFILFYCPYTSFFSFSRAFARFFRSLLAMKITTPKRIMKKTDVCT